MEKFEPYVIIMGSLGILWGLVQTLWKKDDTRIERTLVELNRNHAQLYEKLIETQTKNTDSSNRLSGSVDRLAITVANMENQADDRHNAISLRINDLHEGQELLRKRVHWIINKLSVLKFVLEKQGADIKGDWDSP